MNIPGLVYFYSYILQFRETKLPFYTDGYDIKPHFIPTFISSPHYLIPNVFIQSYLKPCFMMKYGTKLQGMGVMQCAAEYLFVER
jgi:hypothetical protein